MIASSAVAVGGGSDPAADDFLRRAEPFSIAVLGPPPVDPSNRFSGKPEAVSLGRELFLDTDLSASEEVSCATCHMTDGAMVPNETMPAGADRAYRPVMPIVGAAHHDFFGWDGRTDSLWSQITVPLEHPAEHDLTRTEVVRHVLTGYPAEFAAVVGAGFGDVPRGRASPTGDEAARSNWTALSDAQRAAIDTAFVDVAKILASYVESVPVVPSRWDDWIRAATDDPGTMAEIPSAVRRGFDLFTGKGRCATCHFGPMFTDFDFHNTAMPGMPGAPPDPGRQGVALGLITDPLNCAGPFSDAPEGECDALTYINLSIERGMGAFRTPSLRAVSSRTAYGHAGRFRTLEDVVRHYDAAPRGAHGRLVGQGTLTELVPLSLGEDEIADLVAFLESI